MRIGIFRGTSSDTTNQYSERLFLGWGICLSDHVLDAFGSADFPESAEQYYNRIETKGCTYRTPFTKIRATYQHTLEYIRRRDPDLLIQVRSFTTHASGVALAGQRARIPVIIRLPSDAFNEFRNTRGFRKLGVFGLQNICGRIPIQLAEKAIVLGPHGKSLLTNRGMSTKDVKILPPPEDMTGRFRPVNGTKCKRLRSDLGLPTDRRIVLFVGKLIKMKGLEFARSVIQQVISKSDMYFLFVGPGPYRNKLRDEFGDDIIYTPGHVPYTEIDKYYKSADIYMHPSPHEGIPLSILEALDCGVPVVARKAGDINFVIPSTVTTPESMAELLLRDDLKPVWRNRKMFSEQYQREILNDLIREVVTG